LIGLTRTTVALAVALGLAGCGLTPVKPSPTHITAETTPTERGVIPPPVQLAPVLPKPTPAAPPETYSVVVSNVRAQDLLFALARNAKLNVDINSDVTGSVTMNAINQTLPQLLDRIADQVDMRYRLRGSDLVVMRDTPYLHIYHVDYVNLSRDAKSVNSLSTQVINSGTGTAGGGGSSGSSNSTSTINSVSDNKFWGTLVANVNAILQETQPAAPVAVQAPAVSSAAAAGAAGPAAGQSAPATPPARPPATAQPSAPESGSVIANPEAGVLAVRATARQQARIQQFLDQVLASARREVLIEATVAEVQLDNQYQRGIDWSKLRTGSSGFQFQQSSANTPAGVNTNAFVVGYALGNYNFTAAIKLLESFGTVRVLSSPKISVINNQTALLKVVNNLVYFTIQANTTTNQTSALTTFTTTPQTVPVGFIMSVVPQISATDSVLLSLRPTISRKIGDVSDPNPSLAQNNVTSLIPVIQTREMESVLRVESGQIAVLGGLMEDQISDTQDTVPGLSSVPLIGSLFNQRNQSNTKTELVIFLRATVIRNPSTDADFASYRRLLPGPDYLSRPNPAMTQDAPGLGAGQPSTR